MAGASPETPSGTPPDGQSDGDAAAVFAPLRPSLARVAYRMLGSVADAEDVVQDAWLRWAATDRAAVREPAAFLRRVVTRLSLDVLKSARRRRETYVGEWLPEPVVAPEAEPADTVTLPLMLALERLSPLERAAFLLHDVFGLPFEEVAEAIDRDPVAARQLASRARSHVRAARPRFPPPADGGLQIAEAFFTASRTGDVGALKAMLAADVVLHADGGGRRSAAAGPVRGAEAVAALHLSLAAVFAQGSQVLRYGFVNGLPGFISLEADGLIQTTALQVEDGRITAIFVVRNPDKLGHLAVN